MADQVCSVVGVLLTTVSTIMDQRGGPLGEVAKELQLLKIELSQMKPLLEKVDLIQDDDPQSKVWITQVRDISYEIEDAIDEYAFRFAHPHSGGLIGHVYSTLNSIKNRSAHHNFAKKLQGINATVDRISKAHHSYEANIATAAPPKDSWRYIKDDEALYLRDSQQVGIEVPKQDLISKLLQGDSQFQVIAVHGMGGLGKTTLVKKVYDDAVVKSHFQMRAWIPVSQNYDFQKIFKSIIQQVCPASEAEEDSSRLKEYTRDILSKGRYVIVFDDVWGEEFWDGVRYALPENTYGGNRVLLTTRNANVASASCTEFNRGFNNIYKMQPLNREESWDLFCRKVFKHNYCPSHLQRVAERIVAKCEGLPLAIVTFGGILASKDLSGADQWEVALSRVGDDLPGSNYLLERAKKILQLSYDDLPSYLKSCLLYTIIYPEDFLVSSDVLIPQLISERIVEEIAGLDLEEVALRYLKELAKRSLIIVDDVDVDGLPENFHVHDLLRELLVREAMETNMVTIVDDPQLRWPHKDGARRLVYHGAGILHKGSLGHFEKVRSIITLGCTMPLPTSFVTELSSSKFLKLLVLCGIELSEIPKEVFKLFLLTHLDLTDTNVTVVPKHIKRLRNLEYLNVSGSNVRELPKGIRRLQKLRTLYVCSSSSLGFKALHNIGVLSELRDLMAIDVSNNSKTRVISELGKLVQLRELGVTDLRMGDGKELCTSLEKLANLKRLFVSSTNQLSDDGEEAMVKLLDLNHPISRASLHCVTTLLLNGRLEKIPPWIANLQKLKELELYNSCLTGDPLDTLQQLPNLVEISLSTAYEGESVCFRTGCFLKLEKLKLIDMRGLRWMRVEKGAMPFLRKLLLWKLKAFEELPFGIEHLRQLQELKIKGVGEKLTNVLKGDFKTSEECKSIAHIPFVSIDHQQGLDSI